MAERSLNVGMIGYNFMGKAHSNAWRQAPKFFDLPADVVLHTICGRSPKNVEAAREHLGWQNAHRLAGSRQRREHRYRRHLCAERQPLRNRPGGSQERKSNSLREAVGDQCCGVRANGGGRQKGKVASTWCVTTIAAFRPSPMPNG